MQDNVITLTSCKYSDLAKYSTVVNINELDYYLWVYLNPEYVRDAYFIGASEVTDEVPVITFPDTFTRPSTSWIRIKSENLNLTPGLHVYKFMFVEPHSDTSFAIYANYIIQRSDVDKPYIYIERKENVYDERCTN